MKKWGIIIFFILMIPIFIFSNFHQKYWTIQKNNNSWTFVSPNGKSIFINGVTSVQPFQNGPKPPFYISKDFKNDNYEQWAKTTSKRIKEYGFSSIGAWSNQHLQKYIPYTKDLNILISCHNSIDNPEWENEIDTIVKLQVEHLKNDQNLIGYYTDNELDWDKLKPYANKYFKTVYDKIKKYDSNHLILGVRFNKKPPKEVLIASKDYVDAHSFNQYLDHPYIPDTLQYTYELTGKPIVISEFSYFSDDNRSNNPNVFYNSNTNLFQGLVFNQKDRADNYEKFVLLCSETSYIIGTEFFQWNDEPAFGRYDGESYNFGIVDIYDNPYKELINANIKIRIILNH